MTDKKKRIQQIRDRLDGATPGKWEMYPVGNSQAGGIESKDDGGVDVVVEDPEMKMGDWIFFGHAKTDVEFLLSAVENIGKDHARDAETKYEAAISALRTARMFFEELPPKYLAEAEDTLDMINVALEELEIK
jgi:hypothetical protein